MTASSVSLPIIDFEAMRDTNADPEIRKQVAQQIDTACRQYGFFYLINHGIPLELQQAIREQTKQFFAMSLEEKQALYGHYGTVRGYHNYTNDTKLSDNLQHETLAIVQPLSHHRDEAAIDGADIFGPQMKIDDAALHMPFTIILIATELGVTSSSSSSFDFEWLNDLFSVMRLNYYPTCESINDASDVGMREHTDIGMLTFLDQDTHVTSLQIKTADDEWKSVEPVPNSLITWSNGQYRSAMHRVVHKHNQSRHSIATFVDPRFDAIVPTLKEAIPEGETARYPSGCYGDTALSKLKDFYDLTAKTN
ncbi:hypothetical protein BDF22DRAFT_672149 [Syncephalis plumigaleata]|nr:hypothetical protein BDF22DRAFT_672149 [Syncephalis plumigaleata]